jgi:hypothetical protein
MYAGHKQLGGIQYKLSQFNHFQKQANDCVKIGGRQPFCLTQL